MQGDDARTEVEVIDTREARLFHHRLQFFLPGVHANRFCEITIAFGVVCDLAAHPGQELEGVEVVERRERLPYAREFEYQQPPAGTQDAAHLGESDVLVRHVAQAKGDGDAVEPVVREGQLLGVALCGRHAEAVVYHAIAAT